MNLLLLHAAKHKVVNAAINIFVFICFSFGSNLNKTGQLIMQYQTIVNNIFDGQLSFNGKAIQVLQYQYANNPVYRQWNEFLNTDIASVSSLNAIPFLPIPFFKTHKVACGDFVPEHIFESSGTTQPATSRHYVKTGAIYRQSFFKGFEMFYGNIKDWCIIGLLPSYLERNNSSLVLMVDELINASGHVKSGFYLDDFKGLNQTLQLLESRKQKTLLIGVTFALLDFAEQFPMQLEHTTVMETGGMKGRRSELTREEVHAVLCKQLGLKTVHSEYGMTELLSQAYSKGGGKFLCPPWMKVLVRDEEDPLAVMEDGKGVLNIIDLANIDSCAFIATDDAGIVHTDGSFEVIGRVDNSDVRGCSLLFT